MYHVRFCCLLSLSLVSSWITVSCLSGQALSAFGCIVTCLRRPRNSTSFQLHKQIGVGLESASAVKKIMDLFITAIFCMLAFPASFSSYSLKIIGCEKVFSHDMQSFNLP